MIRVLSVIHYPFFGGPHNQVLRLAEPLRARGFSTLAVLPDEPGNAFERLSEAGIEVIRLPLGRFRASLDRRVQREALARLARDVPRLRRLIRAEAIDLVVVHGLANPQAAVAARSCGRPVVWQVLDTRLPPPLRVAFTPLVRALASSVMTTGRAVAEAHPGLPRDAERLHPFFPPVDTAAFAPDASERRAVRAELGLGPGDVVVGCVANLTPQKGLDAFLDVAQQVAAVRPETRFALFGRAMESQRRYVDGLLARASQLRAAGRLVVRDPGADVARHMRALDLFLGTAGARSEGISTTILEAMSCGVPVVSTDVGAIREAVVDGVTGRLAAPGDRASLARHVAELAGDAARRAALAEASRARAVELFDVARCADVHATAFAAALARGAAPGSRAAGTPGAGRRFSVRRR